MRTSTAYLPVTLKTSDDSSFRNKVLIDALNWGLWGLPGINDLDPDEAKRKIAKGENIFSDLPLNRDTDHKLVASPNANEFLVLQKIGVSSLYKTMFTNKVSRYIDEEINFNDLFVQVDIYENMFLINNVGNYIYNYTNFVFYANKQFYIAKKNDNDIDLFVCKENDYNAILATHDINYYLYDYKISLSDIFKLLPNSNQVPLNLIESLCNNDYITARLPKIPPEYATDDNKGLWDLYWPKDIKPDPKWYVQVDLGQEYVAADPQDFVQSQSEVAIDFGTAATVVAVREQSGNTRLLRIGGDFSRMASATDYENPTAIEFVNYQKTLQTWQNEPWRPRLNWENVKCASQAREELKDAGYVQSGISCIKTWARNCGQNVLHLMDLSGKQQNANDPGEKGLPFQLAPLPVESCNGIEGFDKRPLDPIELYAFYLGLYCNNQTFHGGKIYTNYTMTFPVDFESEARDRILQGFRRGLLRSLPASLVESHAWRNKPLFSLTARASEPTAFAAAMLADPALGLEPTDEGLPFAVLDFGGGTVDFAFGLYRNARSNDNDDGPDEIDDKGWEQVLEILDVAGDKNLGGEHLVDLLAFEVVRANAATMLEKEIKFVLPRSCQAFAGSEILFDNSAVSQANLAAVREACRDLWEKGKLDNESSGTMSVNLRKSNGDTVSINLAIKVQNLIDVLHSRIRQGMETFFTAMRQAFWHGDKSGKADSEEKVHILPAGNSWRSPHVMSAFVEAREKMASDIGLVFHAEFLELDAKLLGQKNSPCDSNGNTDIVENTGKVDPHDGFANIKDLTRDEFDRFLYTISDKQLSLSDIEIGDLRKVSLVVDHLLSIKKPRSILQMLCYLHAYGYFEFSHLIISSITATVYQFDNFFEIFKSIPCNKKFLPDSPNLSVVRPDNNSKPSEDKEYITDGNFEIRTAPATEATGQATSAQPNLLTIKTGVALGLLQLLPGEATGMVDHVRRNNEAPFPFTVGPFKKKILTPALGRNANYGKWQIWGGKVTEDGVSRYGYSDRPEAMEGKIMRGQCAEGKLDWGPEAAGRQIMVQATGPAMISFALEKNDGPDETTVIRVNLA